ncbi:RNase H domain-containing protein [Trichonephila clavipes]|nr:RNase H domain-containing protein [Trichonephila clavipes]
MPMRRTDVKLTRLRIGHTRFTHRHLLLGEGAPECPSCKVSYTVRHILIDCPVFNNSRITFFNSSHLTLPDLNKTQTSKPRRKKRPPKNQSNTIRPKIEIKTATHRPRKSAPTEYTTDEEDMIIYDVCEPKLNPKYVLTYKTELVKGQNCASIRSLNFSRGVISETELLTTPDAEILDGFSDQGVIQILIPPLLIMYPSLPHLPHPEPCSVLETTTTTSNTIPTTSQDITQTSKPRRKKRPPKNQSNTIKPKIEIKMAPHRPRKSAPTEYSTDEEEMIIYDVEDEPELNPKYDLTYIGELVKGHTCASIRYDFNNPVKEPC